MRSLLILLFFIRLSYSQFQGVVFEGAPVNQNEHFMFSSSSDTIINGSWLRLADYPQAVLGVNSFYWQETGKIFTCGGTTLQGVPTKACYLYDPAANTYSPADSLPEARWSGKLVRVKDSLYLVGSVGSSFSSPDGKIFKYSPQLNTWVTKAATPSPKLHESSVCVYFDSLIICIGGSASTFSQPSNIVRIYNPYSDSWKPVNAFPVPVTTAHTEFTSVDTSYVLVGGNSPAYNNIIYRGKTIYVSDTMNIEWTSVATNDSTIFRTGVYRVGGAKASSWMLFGPASMNASIFNTVYAVHFDSNTAMQWYRMVPNIPDSAGNRPTLSVKLINDSAQIFLFAGSIGADSVVKTAYKYSFALPVPIGITPVSNLAPQNYKLYQNYPNPFNPATKIRFDVPLAGQRNTNDVKIIIYDILGREISLLVNENLKPGTYEVEWSASGFASGIYFCRLIAGNFQDAKKMLLVK